ncbi:acyl-CoA dehydrogenase family protein [Gordonia polyisoprenivorans]|uniref:acyl-CoA dehydrogenase family protein n=1 Tax=Gordonia polyisoprenivorans TaxID=84595 RepID=UPI001AD6F284|nr:acyl-CoA dehydrogenase family protein [Gordonia polyisoprenivorans]QTI69938.1 acyl-CoA dehydrogenase family protein [Gordonia polyisoprenivorans]
MDFGLNDQQSSIRDMVRRFGAKELAPGYLARAKVAEFPWKEHRRVAELGLLGMLAGPEWGGEEEPDFESVGIMMEELAYADFNISNCVLPPLIITSIMREHAVRRLQEEWMPAIVSGERMVALGLTEPGSGSDAAAMRTKAVKTESGWRLNGEKTSITAIPWATAAIIFAKTQSESGAAKVSAFFVDMDRPGVTMSSTPDPGWLPVGRGTISMVDVDIPADALIGGEGEAFRTVMNNFDFTRPLLALTGIGCAQASIDEAVEHARHREVFGSTLSKFEGISFPLAEHTVHLESARLICYKALWKRTQGLPHTADAAMAKWIGPLVSGRAIHDALLTFGNYGYASEYPHEQRLRDTLAVEIADGTAQVQKIIIARELFGREFVPYDTKRP